jgi:hypothetical protein
VSVHLERVRPGLSPGGLYVRLCTRGEVLAERALQSDDPIYDAAEADGELAHRAAAAGETAWLFVYDGDSGECTMTVVVQP